MKRLLVLMSLVLAVMFLAVPLMAAETSGPTYSSPSGDADSFAEFLNEQDCITHNHDLYIDEARNPIDIYLGIEYLPTKNWVLGARGYIDANNIDRDDWEDNLRAEVGATYRFGPGAE